MDSTFWVSLILFLLVLAAFIWVIWKIQKDPSNADREIGRTLIRMGVTYNLSALLLLQLIANIAEAGIIGSLQDPEVNVGARMSAHMVIAFAGIIAALTWIKSLREFFAAFVTPDLHWGKRLALICLTFFITVLAFVGSNAAPIANMYAVANACGQSTQLDLFLTYFAYRVGIGSEASYIAELARIGLPLTYSPWGGLKNVMVSSILLTGFHMLITVWDVALALKLSITKQDMADAFDGDLYEDPKRNSGGKGNPKGQPSSGGSKNPDPDPDKQPSDKTATAKGYIRDILRFWEMEQKTLDQWSKQIEVLVAEGNLDTQSAFSLELAKVHAMVSTFTAQGKGPNGESKAEIAKIITDIINKKSKGKLTLPKIKK